MHFYEVIITAIALSMDAFAVAMCKGLSVESLKKRHMLIVGLYFGGFQALMPLIGYYLGDIFSKFFDIEAYSSFIAFVLLAFIGISMIREALSSDCDECLDDSFGFSRMIMLAIATSIDALAAGFAFSMNEQGGTPLFGGIGLVVSLVGIITFVLSAIGVRIGNIFGARYKSKAELCGGIVLIGIGLKMVLEQIFF